MEAYFQSLMPTQLYLCKTRKEKKSHPNWNEIFRNFITLAENSYPLTPMDDDKSKLAKGYWEFWRLHKQQNK